MAERAPLPAAPAVSVSREGRVATVELSDPATRNALSLAMVERLVAALDALEGDGQTGAVVVTGAPPGFCSGADLAHLAAADEAALRDVYAGFERVARCGLVTVAAVNGPAVGAGMNLALACDVRVASPRARFDTRFLTLGLHPGGGHTFLLERAVGPQAAAALLLCGDVVDGAEAARIGLAYRCVPAGVLVDHCRQLAAGGAAAPPELLRRTKASLLATPRLAYGEAVEAELVEQLWSVGQPAFVERMGALARRSAVRGR
ncbi:MAG: enoyl-CoA hydratase-related protein [Acidimicrobiales bacterium]